MRDLESKADEYAINLSEILSVPLWDFDDEQIRIIGEGYARNKLVAAFHVQAADGDICFDFKSRPPRHKKLNVLYRFSMKARRSAAPTCGCPWSPCNKTWLGIAIRF